MRLEKSNYQSALTIDVEDGINIAMRDHFNIEMDPTEKVVSNTDIILSICTKNSVKGTFFILGEVVEKFPELVKKISSYGHEIGVHGYKHDQIFRLTPEKLEAGLIKSKKMIEEITGQEVLGFRAPAFSINNKTAWALEIIAKCGFKYDSSIFPSKSFRYGWEGFSKEICMIQLDTSLSLVEVPLSVVNILGRAVPVGGGGYLRYIPYGLTSQAINSIIKKRPAIVYLHPYELDTEKYPEYFYKAMSNAPLTKRVLLKFYRFKKGSVSSKLDCLTRNYSFIPLKDIVSNFERDGLIQSITLPKAK